MLQYSIHWAQCPGFMSRNCVGLVGRQKITIRLAVHSFRFSVVRKRYSDHKMVRRLPRIVIDYPRREISSMLLMNTKCGGSVPSLMLCLHPASNRL